MAGSHSLDIRLVTVAVEPWNRWHEDWLITLNSVMHVCFFIKPSSGMPKIKLYHN